MTRKLHDPSLDLRMASWQQDLTQMLHAGLSAPTVFCLNFVYQIAHAALEHRKPFPPLGAPVLVLVSLTEQVEDTIRCLQLGNFQVHLRDGHHDATLLTWQGAWKADNW